MNSNSVIKKTYWEYNAKFGDTLEDIGLKNNLPSELLYNYNNLNDSDIKIGQIIKIPIVLMDEIFMNNYFEYKVNIGESVEQISNRFNLSSKELADYNNFEVGSKIDGKIINIPIKIESKDENYIEYELNEFDNLQSIAEKYGLTEQEILNYNNLNNEILNCKKIRIPLNENNAKVSSFEYIIKSEDSLETVGRKYGFTAEELKIFNKLSTYNVMAGQVINIPTK